MINIRTCDGARPDPWRRSVCASETPETSGRFRWGLLCRAFRGVARGLLREVHLGRLRRARCLELEVRPWPLAQDLRRQHLREAPRSEEHTSELQSRLHLVCRLLLEKK